MSDDTTTSDSFRHFPALKDGNYDEWAVRMKARLVLKKLWTTVEPVELDDDVEPADAERQLVEGLKKRSKVKMGEAHAEIISCVSAAELVHSNADPRVFWKNLEEVHRATGLSTQLALKRSLFQAVKDEHETMVAWISRVKGLAAKIQLIGGSISDLDIILALTNGLSGSYKDLIHQLDAVKDNELTLKFVVNKLVNWDTIDGKTEATGGSAYATGGGTGSNGGNNGPGRRCYRCGRSGHLRKDCPDRGQGNGGNGGASGAGTGGNANGGAGANYTYAF